MTVLPITLQTYTRICAILDSASPTYHHIPCTYSQMTLTSNKTPCSAGQLAMPTTSPNPDASSPRHIGHTTDRMGVKIA